MLLSIGDLVTSENFTDVGKILSMDEVIGDALVGFFESPLNPSERHQTVKLDNLSKAKLTDEMTVYVIHPKYQQWQRTRYGGPRPNDLHLVIYRRGDSDVFSLADLYVLNLAEDQNLDPSAFLSARCTDSPHWVEWRAGFLHSYIAQRGACRSLSSVLSSSVELEPHQLAVVRRVLQDEHKKYLLADEVGLGKTIEAGMILRELLLQDHDAIAVVTVPEALIGQWEMELEERFFLEELFDDQVYICSHQALKKLLIDVTPSIVIIDEAHLLAPWAWSTKVTENFSFEQIAAATAASDSCLLLSGTPIHGNENNFLAMLHLLSPESYPLTQAGLNDFQIKISERERLGGIYQALTPANDNSTLTDLLDQISGMFAEDKFLIESVDKVRPLVDWLAEEEGEERATSILTLRTYLGENYRLHQRMLRNRREDQKVANLFPGLTGISSSRWDVSAEALSIEQSLDAFRSEFFLSHTKTMAITPDNFKSWIEDALISPMVVGQRAKRLLSELATELEQFEQNTLVELIASAIEEQKEKDRCLLDEVKKWLTSHGDGKVVVFCTLGEVANHVSQLLTAAFPESVEQHQQQIMPAFCQSPSIRILVCDEYGEDGLNLQGGRKLVVHYSLPLSFSRIEQRLGRVNRYSADIVAYPVKSILLLPNSTSYSHYWLNLLDQVVGIFNQSVASLQYVLEAYVDNTWAEVPIVGCQAISALAEILGGDDGILISEGKKVRAQEELNRMEFDISAAEAFSEQIMASDEDAECHAQQMQKWITKGLQFKRINGELPSTFRFCYQTGENSSGRTLMDVSSFIRHCFMGLDPVMSTASSPVTSLMSFDRSVCSHGKKINPFRYGQPFLDTIYRSLNSDTRGISSAIIRVLKNIPLDKPLAGFKTLWMVTHKKGRGSVTGQCSGDELFAAKVVTYWHFSSGEVIDNKEIINLLDKPYDKKGEGIYQDVNLRAERWPLIEEHFPSQYWTELVDKVYQKSRGKVVADIDQQLIAELNYECLAMSAVILCSAQGMS
jgi:ATP-dependent helicase HepA